MNTTPSIDDLLEGVIKALGTDVMPAVATEKAGATVAMMQSLLQGVRQLLPVYDGYIVEEHNEMTAAMRDAAGLIGAADGDAADRLRERASTLGQRPDLPALPDLDANRAAHRELSFAMAASLSDLDELIRADVDGATEALDVLRTHMGKRFVRDAATFAVEGGMIGRG